MVTRVAVIPAEAPAASLPETPMDPSLAENIALNDSYA